MQKKDIYVNRLESVYFTWACKCEFYRPEHNAKEGPLEMYFEGLEIQK